MWISTKPTTVIPGSVENWVVLDSCLATIKEAKRVPKGANFYWDHPVPEWVDQKLGYLSGGQMGTWQEYRHELKIERKATLSALRAIELLVLKLSGAVVTLAPTETIEGLESIADSLYLSPTNPPTEESQYQQSILEELYSRVLSLFSQAHRVLSDVLDQNLKKFRIVKEVIAVYLTFVFFPAIFCSVLWEDRRWFVFHGARPPKATPKAFGASLTEVYSWSLPA